MQKLLIITNDAPYGSEKAYNALRMARTIQNIPDVDSLTLSVELETGKEQAMKIKEYLEVYDTYFE